MEEALLKNLTEGFAPTGNEVELHQVIKDALNGYVDEIKVHEGSNSLIAFKKGESNTSLMLEAHLDEVFMVVQDITKEGFLRVVSNSIDAKVLPGSIVLVHGKERIKGVIGIKPYHLIDKGEEHKPYNFDNLYIDCGLPRDELEKVISVGDYVTFIPNFTKVNDYYSSKSLDNRLCVYTIIEVLKALKHIKHQPNIYGLFSSQEEFTALGAITSTFSIFPDAAIALDVTLGVQNEVPPDVGFPLGKGPVIFVGVTATKFLSNKLIKTAEEYGIPHQKEGGIYSGTDTDEIELVKSGVPATLVSIPVRYLHTPIEMFDPFDLDKTVQLLKLFIENYSF